MKALCWLGMLGVVALAGAPAMGGEAPTEVREMGPTEADVYKTLAVATSIAFVMGISVIGAAYAVGRIGSAALGAAAEKPEILTRSILFVALAEGLAVLGFAVAMMLMGKMP